MSQLSTAPARDSSPSWSRRLQFALPLAVGLLLIGLFVFLAIQAGLQSEPAPAASDPVKPAATRESQTELPVGIETIHPPEIVGQSPPKPPQSSGLKRWNISEYPEGWDPEIAEKIAQLFDRIHYDYTDPDAYVEAARALEELEKYLEGLDGESVPTLATILHHEPFFINRRRMILTLGRLGPENEDTTFHLLDFFNKHKGDIKNSPELNYVVKAMGMLQNETAPAVLGQLIGDETLTPDYRAGFIRSLGDHPDSQESVPLFVENMMNAKAFKMRNNSAQALGKVRDPRTLPQLVTAFEEEPAVYAKQTILGTMGKIGSPTSIPYLGDVARTHKSREVRVSAAKALHRIYESSGSPQALYLLEEISETEPDAAVRQRVIEWIHGPTRN